MLMSAFNAWSWAGFSSEAMDESAIEKATMQARSRFKACPHWCTHSQVHVVVVIVTAPGTSAREGNWEVWQIRRARLMLQPAALGT